MQSTVCSARDDMERRNERGRSSQIIPSLMRPASLIMFWFQGGSQTSWTSASSMPSMDKILLWASCAMAGPHSATRRSESHLHIHFQAAFRPLCQLTTVNQTEINDVNRNLGVETLPQVGSRPLLVAAPLAQLEKKRTCLRRSSASQLDER